MSSWRELDAWLDERLETLPATRLGSSFSAGDIELASMRSRARSVEAGSPARRTRAPDRASREFSSVSGAEWEQRNPRDRTREPNPAFAFGAIRSAREREFPAEVRLSERWEAELDTLFHRNEPSPRPPSPDGPLPDFRYHLERATRPRFDPARLASPWAAGGEQQPVRGSSILRRLDPRAATGARVPGQSLARPATAAPASARGAANTPATGPQIRTPTFAKWIAEFEAVRATAVVPKSPPQAASSRPPPPPPLPREQMFTGLSDATLRPQRAVPTPSSSAAQRARDPRFVSDMRAQPRPISPARAPLRARVYDKPDRQRMSHTYDALARSADRPLLDPYWPRPNV